MVANGMVATRAMKAIRMAFDLSVIWAAKAIPWREASSGPMRKSASPGNVNGITSHSSTTSPLTTARRLRTSRTGNRARLNRTMDRASAAASAGNSWESATTKEYAVAETNRMRGSQRCSGEFPRANGSLIMAQK